MNKNNIKGTITKLTAAAEALLDMDLALHSALGSADLDTLTTNVTLEGIVDCLNEILLGTKGYTSKLTLFEEHKESIENIKYLDDFVYEFQGLFYIFSD